MVISMGVTASQTDGSKIVYLGRDNMGYVLEYLLQLLYLPGEKTRIVEFTGERLVIVDDRHPWTPLHAVIPTDSDQFTYTFTPATNERALGSFKGVLLFVIGHVVRNPELMKNEAAWEAARELVCSLK